VREPGLLHQISDSDAIEAPLAKDPRRRINNFFAIFLGLLP
jgi:hypothetical protein